MRSKSYAPVQIQNPSEGHLVPLKPNQNFVLILKGRDPEVEFNSSFFRLYKKEYTSINGAFKTLFHFAQIYDLTEQSAYSQIYLGEVEVLVDNRYANLHVFVECTNKSLDLLTVVNPDANFVKINASTTLKIIISDEKYNNKWDCDIISGDNGIRYQQVTEACYRPPKFGVPDFSNQFINEWHYWFRLDDSEASDLEYGIHPAGKIVFHSDEYNTFKVLNLNLRVKYKQKILHNNKPAIIYPSERPYQQQVIQSKNKVYAYSPHKKGTFKKEISLVKKLDCSLDSANVCWW